MPSSLTHGNRERGTATSRRRVSVPSSIIVLLSTLAFMTVFELVKTLLFRSLTLWESHLITIVVSGAVATVASVFVLHKFRAVDKSYGQLVEGSPDAMFVHRRGKIVLANGASALLLGVPSADKLLGRQVLDFVHPDDRAFVEGKIRTQYEINTIRQRETRLRRLDGTEVATDAVARSILYQGEYAVQVTYRDISLRKQAEKRLLESEASLAAAQRVAHLGSWEQDITNPDDFDEGPLRWSDEAFRIYGFEPRQGGISRTDFLRTVHPDDRELIRRERAAAIREKRPYSADYRVILPNGTERNIHSQFDIVYDEKTKRPSKTVGIVQDVTDRKKAEERFFKAFNANPEPITIATLAEGRYIDVNESFLRITGYRREEVIGRTSLDVKFWNQPEDRTRLVEKLKTEGSVRDLEINFSTKSGEQRTGLDSAEIIEIAGEKCVIAIMKDITDRQMLEKQLRQAQKMEAVGQLSGGIAHDFNNLLGVIIGYSEILEERLDQGSKLRQNAEEIKKAGQRAASLTRQLLAFSRQQVLEPKVLSLNTVVADTEKMLRRLIGEDIQLTTVLASELGHAKADIGQIEQVIVNLAVNARDAMPDGGKLTIETSIVELDEEYALRHPPTIPGEYIALLVTDTGIGMDAETRAHIFEPFFTTKELGKGTGLGLSTVYGIIKQSGGYVWVYSEPGLGTTFKIYLPRVDKVVSKNRPSGIASGFLQGSETILLVEDEESLRNLTRTLLERGGYTVLEASGGSQAVEIARQHQGPIHLLLTDMVMPGMNGRAVAENLKPVRPEMKVVYMSGYMSFTSRGLLDPEAIFLPKPVTRDALFLKVSEALNLQKASTTT
jgi:two-component system cell cycle sensor histidine kinase/response regulator CckA